MNWITSQQLRDMSYLSIKAEELALSPDKKDLLMNIGDRRETQDPLTTRNPRTLGFMEIRNTTNSWQQ